MRRAPAPNDFKGWVHQLAVTSCRQRAKQHLMQSGSPALPALRYGLQHPNPIVRRSCAAILDHLVDEASIPDLVAALDDDDPGVCARVLHALACDRCKQNECRPGDDLFVPRAFELLREHPNVDVRAAAMDALANVARRSSDVAEELAEAIENERHPQLRTAGRQRMQRLRRARVTATR